MRLSRVSIWLLAASQASIAANLEAEPVATSSAAAMSASTAQPSPQPVQPGDIVVTAQRRSERLQDVPIQVNAFAAQTLENARVRDVQGAVSLVPNMTMDKANAYHSSYITLRGITEIENADPPVSVIIDGVPQTNQRQINASIADAQQVEILKGPQGSLYGRNAEAGAINIVTKPPTNSIAGGWDLSYANGKTIDASANVSGPLVKDVLLFRVDANYVHSDGLVGNTFTGGNDDFIDHDYTVSGRLIFKPTSRLTFDARGRLNDFRAGSNYYSLVPTSDPNDFTLPQNGHLSQSYGRDIDGTLKVDYDLGFATLTSISGYSHIRENNDQDLDFSNAVDRPGGFNGTGLQVGAGQQLLARIFSQEVRLVSQTSGPLKYSFGAYYLHSTRDFRTRVYVDLDGSEQQQSNPALVIADQPTRDHNDSYAGFGQIDYNITDKLIATAGFRYDVDDRQQQALPSDDIRTKRFQKAQPKGTLTYKFARGNLAYVTYGVGFRSGGFNVPNASIPDFKQESLTNLEAGFKTSFANGRLAINGAIYRENVSNYQYFFVDVTSGSQVIGNIDRVHITGAELEIVARPFAGLTANAGFGYTHTDIAHFAALPQYEGNKTARNIPFSATGSLDYRAPLSDTVTGVARIDYQYNSKRYWTYVNNAVQHGWTLIGGRVGIETGGLGVFVFTKNLLNTKYYTDYQPGAFTGLDVDVGFRGQPRTYGVEARYKF